MMEDERKRREEVEGAYEVKKIVDVREVKVNYELVYLYLQLR